MKNNYEEIVEYANILMENNPSITAGEMKKHLNEKFITGASDVHLGANSCCYNPINYNRHLISIIVNSIRKYFLKDKNKLKIIQNNIDKALMQLTLIN